VKIVVFGATGGTGREVVRQGLEAGHEITVFVRDPAAFNDSRVRVVVGDTLRDDAKVVEAVRGQDAVVSALGVRRLIVVSAFGVGDSRADAPLLPRMLYRLMLTDIFADKKAAEDDLRRSSVDWVVAYPTLLTDGPLTGRYRVGEKLALRGMPRISRADTAHFVLSQLESRDYVRKVAVISE
jgi:putative NADH-flavin reductase